HNIEEFGGILQRQCAAIVQIRRAVFVFAKRECLYRAVSKVILVEALNVLIMPLVVQIKKSDELFEAQTFSEKDLLATQLAFRRSLANEMTGCRIKFRCRWEVQHVLHLRHVTHLNAIENVHAFLDRMNLVTVEIRRALFELGEVLDRAQASLGAMDLLILHTAQADSVQSEPAFLRSHIRSEVELSGCVAGDVAIQTGHSEAGGCSLAVVSGIELFLWKWH